MWDIQRDKLKIRLETKYNKDWWNDNYAVMAERDMIPVATTS